MIEDTPVGDEDRAEIYGRPGFLLRRCHQLSVGVFLDACRQFSLTPTQYGLLTALDIHGPLDQIGVGRIMGHDRTTVGTVVERLAKRDLITRTVDPSDRRKRRLLLTDQGRALRRDAAEAVDQAQERLLAGLSPADREQLLVLLRRVLGGADGHARAEIDWTG